MGEEKKTLTAHQIYQMGVVMGNISAVEGYEINLVSAKSKLVAMVMSDENQFIIDGAKLCLSYLEDHSYTTPATFEVDWIFRG